jgi:amino acid transporter
VIATNAGLIGISRLSYSLASNRLFPGAFSRLHPKFKTPYFSIIVFGLGAAVLILPAQITLMAAVYSLAATFAFATAHLAVLRLRYVAPEMNRPWRMPLNVRFGHGSVPILSVVGALAIGSVFTELAGQDIAKSSFIFIGWLVLGVVAFVVYRRATKQPLWEPLQMPPEERRPRPVGPPITQVVVGPPSAQRVHLGRRGRPHHEVKPEPEPEESEAVAAVRSWLEDVREMGPVRSVVILVIFLFVSVAAILFDLSPYDPFGPRLGWSVGVVIVAFFATFILLRSRRGL